MNLRSIELTDIPPMVKSHSDLTPIEHTFFARLLTSLRVHAIERRLWLEIQTTKEPTFKTIIYQRRFEDPTFNVVLQAQIEDMRVDFVVIVVDQKRYLKIAIECDGHEFHEKTKEQAKKDRSRDRRLQALNYHIFRFTGSEIHNDDTSCVDELLRFVNSRMSGVIKGV
jgi:very-short-patch-repair endonuclease